MDFNVLFTQNIGQVITECKTVTPLYFLDL